MVTGQGKTGGLVLMLTAQYPKALLLEGCQLWYTGNTLVDQIPVLFPSDFHVTWPKVKVSLLVFTPNVYKDLSA